MEQIVQRNCDCPIPGSVQVLDRAWSIQVWFKVSLPMAAGWNCMIFEVSPNLGHSMVL